MSNEKKIPFVFCMFLLAGLIYSRYYYTAIPLEEEFSPVKLEHLMKPFEFILLLNRSLYMDSHAVASIVGIDRTKPTRRLVKPYPQIQVHSPENQKHNFEPWHAHKANNNLKYVWNSSFSLEQLVPVPVSCSFYTCSIDRISTNCTSNVCYTLAIFLALLVLPGFAASQSLDNRIPITESNTFYAFPPLPSAALIFSTQAFCRTTYTTCMDIFRDCLRVTGAITGANQICETWRDGTCERGIREGCDQLLPENQEAGNNQSQSRISFATTEVVIETSTAISASEMTEMMGSSIELSELLTSTANISTSIETSVQFTITLTNSVPKPTTGTSRSPTPVTDFSTATTTSTLINSDGIMVTTTWTMMTEVTDAAERGLRFAVNGALSDRNVGEIRLWLVVLFVGLQGCI